MLIDLVEIEPFAEWINNLRKSNMFFDKIHNASLPR